MRGQWQGKFDATGWSGSIVIDAEQVGEETGGSVFLYPTAPGFTSVVGRITPAEVGKSTAELHIVCNPLHPATGALVPWDQLDHVFPGVRFGTIVQANCEWQGDKMKVTWNANIGTAGQADLTKNDATRPSDVEAQRLSWQQFKEHITQLEHRRHIFRGQRKPWRLRSNFHRHNRCDLMKYTIDDMPVLHRHLSGRTRHIFDRSKNDENGAMLHLAQHHGFPTPLIDWSYSPFVAAFFAFHRITNSDARSATDDDRVRILQFDRKRWCDGLPQYGITAPLPPHFSLMEFLAIENQRLIPQQAISGLTNVDDVETYIAGIEGQVGHRFLTAIDLPINERETAMRELALMGVTAGSLFPGLDGACEELRERLFPS